MSTAGRRYRKHGGHLIQVNGENVPMHSLPAILAEHERIRGEPLTVTMPPTLEPAHQRLLAVLGVRVVFADAPGMDYPAGCSSR